MEQHIFAFSMIIEVTTEKLLQFVMPFTNKTLVSLNKNFFLNSTDLLKNN